MANSSIRLEIKLPENWSGVITDTTIEVEDKIVGASLQIELGEMPYELTAADQALVNYVDMVGFDDEDDEEYSPLQEWMFNGRKGYGFEAYCEDDRSIRVLCVEPKRGVLLIINVIAANTKAVDSVMEMLERRLRIK